MPVRGHWDLLSLRQPAGRTHDKDLSQVCNEDAHRCGEESERVWSDSFANFLTIFFPFASVLHCSDHQISNENNLKEEGFIWAPLSRDVTPWPLGSKHLGRASWWQEYVGFHFMADHVAESSTEQGLHNRSPRTLHNDLIPPVRLHFLESPQPHKILLCAGNQWFNTWAFWEQCPKDSISLSWRFTQHHRPLWECSTYAWCPIWGKFLKDSAYKVWVCRDLEAQAPATYGMSKFQSARGSCVLGRSHYPGFISEKDPDKRQLNENRSFFTYNSWLVYYFMEVMAEIKFCIHC